MSCHQKSADKNIFSCVSSCIRLVCLFLSWHLSAFVCCLSLLSGWCSYGGNSGGLHRSASHSGQRPHKQRRDRQHANHTAVCAGTYTWMIQHASNVKISGCTNYRNSWHDISIMNLRSRVVSAFFFLQCPEQFPVDTQSCLRDERGGRSLVLIGEILLLAWGHFAHPRPDIWDR